jgi:hypothetical protein
MDVAKVHDDDFLQRMNCKIETQAGRVHLYEMEIIKHKMLTDGIETQQRLKEQQLVNKRIEGMEAVLLQNANVQIQLYQTRINELQQLASQQEGALNMRIIQGVQKIISSQTKIEKLLRRIQMLTQSRPSLN